MNPGIRILRQRVDRAHLDLPVHQHRNAVGSRPQAVEIVGHQKHGKAQTLLKVPHQLVELGRRDRIEPRGRLVQEQQFGIESERPREARALAHPPRQFGGEFLRRVGRQPDQR